MLACTSYRGYKADHAILVSCALVFRFASRIMSVNRYVMYPHLLHSLSMVADFAEPNAGSYIIGLRRVHLLHA